jgi:hypothetical protein
MYRRVTVVFYRDAPDIRQDNPAFLHIRYLAGYPVRPDTGYPAGYPAYVDLILLWFLFFYK